MTTLPPHPGLSGLAAREATTPADITRAADDDADHEGLTHAEWEAVNARIRAGLLARIRDPEWMPGARPRYAGTNACGCCPHCGCACHKEER